MKKCRENITFQIAVNKPITKQDTQENGSTSLRAKCMLVPPPTPFLPIILNKSISDSSPKNSKVEKSK
jgi:hypothetical protein